MSEDRWCILRTAGPRTLPLARSLAAAGIEAWTPTVVVNWRRSRSKATVERDAPVLPTFVFVAEHHLPIVLAALTLPVSPHPPFSVFRFAGRIERVRAAAMSALREYEASEAEARRVRLERHAKVQPKKPRAIVPPIGTRVRATTAGTATLFAGMTGTVVGRKGRAAQIDFGGKHPFEIEAWLIEGYEVEPQPA